MSGFLLSLRAPRGHARGADCFERGLAASAALGLGEPARVVRGEAVQLATFRRANGSGGDLGRVGDRWLASAGTWFGPDGTASGDEERLQEHLSDADGSGWTALARRLDGPFVLVGGRSDEPAARLISDRFGDRRAYWGIGAGGTMLVSTSSLLLAAVLGTELDPLAVQEFLYTGIVYEDRTLFSRVRRLPPASVVELAPSRPPRARGYWRLDTIAAAAGRPEDVLREALVDVAGRIGRRFPRPCCDLTGGYDSRAVLSAFRGAGLAPATTVCGDENDADVTLARRLAARAGLPILRFADGIETPARSLDDAVALTDGEFEALEYSRIAHVHRELSRRWQVSVSGSFGEFARGHWYELLGRDPDAPGTLDARRIAAARYATAAHDAGTVRPRERISLVDHMTGVLARAVADLEGAPRSLQLDASYGRVRMASWHARIASSTDRLWPNLSPFAFASVSEAAMAAPATARRRGLLVRRMLARHDPELARIDLDDGHPAEPLSWRNAHRYLPALARLGGRVAAHAGLRRSDSAAAAGRLRLRRTLRELAGDLTAVAPEVLDPGGLRSFLAASDGPDFGYHEQWLRLVTLERALALASAAGRRGDRAAITEGRLRGRSAG